MLKVVGANEWKTRLGSYILLSTCLLCILLVITATMEREELSGTYCSTVFWSPKAGFHIEFWGQRHDLENVSKGVARACYRHSIMEQGWSFLEIETQAEYPDRIQAFAAGMLEGALTWKPIYDHWSNTIGSDCEKDDESHKFCAWAKDILNENYDNIKQEAEIKNRESHYWYQIRLFYYQMSGLEHGWQLGVRQSREDLEIPEEDFRLLNTIADWRDLQDYYSKFIDPAYVGGHHQKTGTLFLKLLNGNDSKIMIGHSSDGPYSSMLRMHKHYYFRYHLSTNSKSHVVPGTNISFTGYPGTLYSSDDFYIVSNKGANNFVIGGIRMEQENKTVWEEVVLDDSPILGARVMAANRLAMSGRSWCKYMSHRSATGVKQWLLVDTHQLYKNLSDDNEVDGELNVYNEGSIWVADQVPGKLHFKDVTVDLHRKGFWFSNGAPYIEETITMSNTNLSNHSAKLKFVEFYQQNITDLLELATLFNRLGYRGDMDLEFPEYFGNIDMKLYSMTSSDTVEFLSNSGPTKKVEAYSPPQALRSAKSVSGERIPEGFPVRMNQFSWSDDMPMQHEGQPETFDFDFVSPTWAWVS